MNRTMSLQIKIQKSTSEMLNASMWHVSENYLYLTFFLSSENVNITYNNIANKKSGIFPISI